MLYHKINSIFKRDKNGALIYGDFSTPALAFLAHNQWQGTEKFDGTNCRIFIDAGGEWSVGGRTEASQFSADLLKLLNIVGEVSAYRGLRSMTLFGEGVGAGIQKGGGNYGLDPSFVLFDVYAHAEDGLWLERENVNDIAEQIGVKSAPTVFTGTLFDSLDLVCRDYAMFSTWGQFPAEGLVLRPLVELADRRGNRVITKVKQRDKLIFNYPED